MRVAMILGVIALVFVAIGHVEFFKSFKNMSYGRYLLRWVKGIGSAFSQLMVSWCGIPPVQKTTTFDRGDRKYDDITLERFIDAAVWANAKMEGFGMTLDAYKPNSNDCDDYAWVKAGLMRFYLHDSGGGVPIGVIGYQRDVGGYHGLIQAIADGERVFMEAFPEYDKIKKLSQKEIDSIFVDIM